MMGHSPRLSTLRQKYVGKLARINVGCHKGKLALCIAVRNDNRFTTITVLLDEKHIYYSEHELVVVEVVTIFSEFEIVQ